MFGDFVEVYEENVITNSINPKTRPAICMGPSGNIQKSIKFMCMDKGKNMVRRNYARLPMPDSIIKKVEKLADRARMKNRINFKNKQRNF